MNELECPFKIVFENQEGKPMKQTFDTDV